MPKKKERNSDEFYRSKIRKLEKQVRELQRELKYYERREHHFEEIVLKEEDNELVEISKKIVCTDCGKGELTVVLSLHDKNILECNLCYFRKAIKT